VQRFHRLLLALIAASLVTQAWLIIVQEFNWDEFSYLGQVHDYLRGGLTGALQTIHVHLFAPLAGLPGNEIDQLIAGRWVMLLCEGVTLLAIYKLCRIWAERGPALFAVCAYAVMAATLQHGASFRVDPLALSLSMAALALLARSRPNWVSAAAIALLAALSALVTIKVIFFAPAFAGVALWRHIDKADRKAVFRWLASVAILTPILFLLLYWAHQASLPAGSVAGAQQMARGAASKVFSDTMLFLRRRVLLEAMYASGAQWGLILVGIVVLGWSAMRGLERRKALALLACAAPLLALLVYRNAFPYFIPFITAPAFVVVAWLIQSRRWPIVFQSLLLALMLGTALLAMSVIVPRNQDNQRRVVAAVHEIFPTPVWAIDHAHMIAGFPKSGFLMSNWGMENYLAGSPLFANLLAQEPVPLLLVDGKPLQEAMGEIEPDVSYFMMKPEDRAVLRDNYIEHWGPIWVAGKRLAVSTTERPFEIAVPGDYTIEGSPARIDGRPLANGQLIRLDRGTHRIAGASGGSITLRWGNHLPRPAAAPPSGPLFVGF